MKNVYSEEQWFDTFYPEELGNWKEEFNMREVRSGNYETGCSWMDYEKFGYVTNEDPNTGLMKVKNYTESDTLEHFFIQCNKSTCAFIQPIYQPLTKQYFASVSVRKIESNLDLYKMYIRGCDDSSYTKHFIGEKHVAYEIRRILREGIDYIQYAENGFFFTN